jgi:hypothetical protein
MSVSAKVLSYREGYATGALWPTNCIDCSRKTFIQIDQWQHVVLITRLETESLSLIPGVAVEYFSFPVLPSSGISCYPVQSEETLINHPLYSGCRGTSTEFLILARVRFQVLVHQISERGDTLLSLRDSVPVLEARRSAFLKQYLI